MKRIPASEKISLFDRFFSYLERRQPSDRFLIYLLLSIVLASGLFGLKEIDQANTEVIPTSGGTMVEGVIGTPRFINPVLATTKADMDLVTLTYSGLLKLDDSGELENDLAKSITVSEDKLVYNVVMRDDRYFHDGAKVFAEDVAFTVSLLQDPNLKSPLRGNWTGVVVEVVGEFELNFVLEAPYAPFVENLTVGILPKHVWSSLSSEEFPFSQKNIEPVGSGAYQVEEIKRGPSGLINEFTLKAAYKGLETANISNIIMRFYQNESDLIEAVNKKEITSTASLSEEAASKIDLETWQVLEKPLPRVFAVYFNQNKSPALRESAVREALEVMIDRDDLINTVLYGAGSPTDTPIPPGFSDIEFGNSSSTNISREERISEARGILFEADWVEKEDGHFEKEIDEVNTPLSLTIRSANTPMFDALSDYLEQEWSNLGVLVTVELFEQSDLVQTIIRPRDYQGLLFGADVGRALDFYPFWHSSQREDPGLNVALYTNITTDKLLVDIRNKSDKEEKRVLLQEFTKEITSETPAIFLFSPSFIYVTAPHLRYADMEHISKPSERFSNIKDWYMNESTVWPIFAQE